MLLKRPPGHSWLNDFMNYDAHILTQGQYNSSEINLDYASDLAGFIAISPGSHLDIG